MTGAGEDTRAFLGLPPLSPPRRTQRQRFARPPQHANSKAFFSSLLRRRGIIHAQSLAADVIPGILAAFASGAIFRTHLSNGSFEGVPAKRA